MVSARGGGFGPSAKKRNNKKMKTLSKQEAKEAREANLSIEEYAYIEACRWAVLMGEEMPNKNEFINNFRKGRR